MNWDPEALLADFLSVARLAGAGLARESIDIEILRKPHRPPTRLPPGKMAVYVFSDDERVLKVGKVGPRSQARYTSQHYRVGSAPSTLAASILKDAALLERHQLDEASVSDWIKNNTHRVNFIIDSDCGVPALTLLEAFLQCRLSPTFEGFSSQR